MKTSNKVYTAVLLTAVLTAGGCKDSEMLLTPELPTTASFVIIDGDTIKTRKEKDFDKIKDKDPKKKSYIVVGDTVVLYKKPKLHTPPAKDPDLSKLKNNDDPDLKGKTLRYVAIGGNLTSGFRDGGYFNEGIETSYPNLIARQMKLKKFEQPLFDAADYNGFGRKARTGENWTGGPVPKFKAVENNSGVEYVDDKVVKLKKYKGSVDNWGFGNTTQMDLPVPPSIFFERIDKENRKERYLIFKEQLDKEKFDIFSIERGNWSTTPSATSLQGTRPYSTDPIEELMVEYSKKKLKGLIFTTPDFWDFPIYKTVKPEDLKKHPDYKFIFSNLFNVDGSLKTDFLIRPSSTLDSLIGVKVSINLKPKSIPTYLIVQKNEYEIRRNYNLEDNQLLESYGRKYNFPVVDLYSIYKRIMAGSYITHDGVRIDPSYPNGNFFSCDAVYPTPLGNAVIANEAILVLNKFYGLSIPLIPTKEYLETK